MSPILMAPFILQKKFDLTGTIYGANFHYSPAENFKKIQAY